MPIPKRLLPVTDNKLLLKFSDKMQMRDVMRKPVFLHMQNKGADQLHGYPAADQGLCFRYIDRTIPLPLKSEISSL